MPSRAPLFFADLKHRADEEELMDSPDADLAKLKRTIEEFGLLNALFSRFVGLFKKHVLPTLLTEDREWTILDVGSGGADLDRAVVRLCRRHGVRVKITALDADPRVLPWARELSKDYPEITPITGSVFDLGHKGLEGFDFIVSNHTLHHLKYGDVRRAVELCAQHARRGILLGDLKRSSMAYIFFTLVARFLVGSSLSYADGRLSIRRGFSVAELEAELAGLPVAVGRLFPSRVFLIQQRT